ncbi:MAG TPA: chorismate mutase [Candidatus Nitrosocosmicus sp.]|nr:chorismate mutase [Candidatus Nitrosocosmicus sp.]
MDIKDCSSLEEIRYHIDLLDREIVSLLAKRGEYVRQAAKFKENIGSVEDKNRINEIITKVAKYAKEINFDSSIVAQIYAYMIRIYVEYEKKSFRQRKN